MNRYLAFMCALLFAFISVSSACMAAPSELIHDASRDRDQQQWSNGVKPSELIGLDVVGFYSAGSLS